MNIDMAVEEVGQKTAEATRKHLNIVAVKK